MNWDFDPPEVEITSSPQPSRCCRARQSTSPSKSLPESHVRCRFAMRPPYPEFVSTQRTTARPNFETPAKHPTHGIHKRLRITRRSLVCIPAPVPRGNAALSRQPPLTAMMTPAYPQRMFSQNSGCTSNQLLFAELPQVSDRRKLSHPYARRAGILKALQPNPSQPITAISINRVGWAAACRERIFDCRHRYSTKSFVSTKRTERPAVARRGASRGGSATSTEPASRSGPTETPTPAAK